jgi:hypothetical protein
VSNFNLLPEPTRGELIPRIRIVRGRGPGSPYVGPDFTDEKGNRYQCCELADERWYMFGRTRWVYVRVGDEKLFRSVFRLAQIQWQREMSRIVTATLAKRTRPIGVMSAEELMEETQQIMQQVVAELVPRPGAPRRRMARGGTRV